MAEMLIQSESLTAIADEIRVLSGTDDSMGLDAMKIHVGEANTDIATEADLIEQIVDALEGKAAGSSGDGYDEADSLITMDITSYANNRVSSIGTGAFAHASKLTTVNFPTVTNIGSSAFAYCSNLTTISFPVATTIGSSAFTYCSNLTTISLPAATTIGSFAFAYCSRVTTVHLLGSSLCTLSNSNAFNGTGIKSNAGSIYVPASLLTSYKTATNWTYFSSRFVAFDSEINMITFTIDSTEYQAEEGMTWAEWCNSNYNTDNYYTGGTNSICHSDTAHFVSDGYNDIVNHTDIIENGANYILFKIGGGGAN